MEIEVRNKSGASRKIRANPRDFVRGRIMGSWMADGDCFIDLDTGDVLSEAAPITAGFYEVDLDTGRVVGSAWRVPMADLETLSSRPIGSEVVIEHGRSSERGKVQLVDAEPSRGIVRVMASPPRYADGRCLPTGWRVTSADLERLRDSFSKRVA